MTTLKMTNDTVIEIDSTEKPTDSSQNQKSDHGGGVSIFLMMLLPLLFIGLITTFFFIAKPLIWPEEQSFAFKDNFVGTIDCGDATVKIISAKYGRYLLAKACETDVTEYAIEHCQPNMGVKEKCVFPSKWIKAHNDSIIDDCPGIGRETHVNFICIDWDTKL